MNYEATEMQQLFGRASINPEGKKKSASINLPQAYRDKMNRLREAQAEREELAAGDIAEVWE